MTDFNSLEYKKYIKDQRDDDTIGRGLGYKYMPKLVKELLPKFDYSLGDILDIGPGPFTTWDWFVEHYHRSIHGIDIGKCVLQEMEEKKWPAEKKASLRCPVDAHELPKYIETSSYDMVISFHAFEHMFDLPLVLKNVCYALRRSGYLYFALPIPAYNWGKGHWYDIPNVETMNKMTVDAGFTVLYSELISDMRYRPEQEMLCLAKKL